MAELKNLQDIDKSYISDYDIFLAEFDRDNPPSQSQLDEIKKHQDIAKLRDGEIDTE